MVKPTPIKSPVDPASRIQSLDILRGFAVLGILIMNIQSYSMVGGAYLNPTAYGNLEGLNKWVWILSHLFADQKFMTLFSLLFGAGIILFTDRIKMKGIRPAGLHYRRTFWLLVLGLMHAYLLWYGDILVTYALCALTVFLFRKLSPKKLLIIGLVVVSVAFFLYLLFGLSMHQWPEQSYKSGLEFWQPEEAVAAKEVEAYRGSWLEQMRYRIPAAIFFQTLVFLVQLGWRAGGLMLIGMAFYKWGILSAQRSPGFYRKMIFIGFGVGTPVIIYGMVSNFRAGWSFDFSMYLGSQFNYVGSLFMAAGYIGLVMLICRSGVMKWLTRALAAAGRMAFTNYIGQSVICTLIFYGHGLGLYGRVERTGQILIVFGIWIFQLALSPFWLRRFRFGPLEWLWRSLTYWKIQPFRLQM